jgi:Nitrate and nitrite sensing
MKVSPSCTISCVDPVMLRRALRLVHCLQKERGASCAFYASSHEHNIVENMERARVDSDRAVQMMLSGRGEFKVHATLMKIRKMVQVDVTVAAKRGSCHRILVCFNALISSIVHDYFMEKIALQERTLQLTRKGSRDLARHRASPVQCHKKSSSKKEHHRARSLGDCLLFSEATPKPPQPLSNKLVGSDPYYDPTAPTSSPPQTLRGENLMSNGSDSGPRHRRADSETSPAKHVQFNINAPDKAEEVLTRLLSLLACFVKLKESTGVERAILSSLVVAGKEDSLLLSDLVLVS